jgi:hypothetical protein
VDPDLLRAHVSMRMLLDRSVDLWARPGIAEAAAAAGSPPEAQGPDRDELEAIVTA